MAENWYQALGRGLSDLGQNIPRAYNDYQDEKWKSISRNQELQDMIDKRVEYQKQQAIIERERAKKSEDEKRIQDAIKNLTSNEDKFEQQKMEYERKKNKIESDRSLLSSPIIQKGAQILAKNDVNDSRQNSIDYTMDNPVINGDNNPTSYYSLINQNPSQFDQNITTMNGSQQINQQINNRSDELNNQWNKQQIDELNRVLPELTNYQDYVGEQPTLKRNTRDDYVNAYLKTGDQRFLNISDREQGGRYDKTTNVKPVVNQQSFRDLRIPPIATDAWDRSVSWFNSVRKNDPTIDERDLMEKFNHEMITDGLKSTDSRAIVNDNASRIKSIYNVGFQNPYKGTQEYQKAGESIQKANEQGLNIPNQNRIGKSIAWSKQTTDMLDGVIKETLNTYNYKDKIDQISTANGSLDLLNKDNITIADLSAAITKTARSLSPGVVTDQDFKVLTNYGAPAGVRTWDDIKKWATGLPTSKSIHVISGINEVLKASAKRQAKNVLNIAYQRANAIGLNVDQQRLKDFISPYGVDVHLSQDKNDPTPKSENINVKPVIILNGKNKTPQKQYNNAPVKTFKSGKYTVTIH